MSKLVGACLAPPSLRMRIEGLNFSPAHLCGTIHDVSCVEGIVWYGTVSNLELSLVTSFLTSVSSCLNSFCNHTV